MVAWCVNTERPRISAILFNISSSHLIHTTKSAWTKSSFLFQPLHISKNQPLRCHSTSKAAWPTSQVLAPTGKYELSRCSWFHLFFYTFRDVLNLLFVCTYSFQVAALTIDSSVYSSSFAPKLFGNKRCKLIIIEAENADFYFFCSAELCLHIIIIYRQVSAHSIWFFYNEPCLIF